MLFTTPQPRPRAASAPAVEPGATPPAAPVPALPKAVAGPAPAPAQPPAPDIEAAAPQTLSIERALYRARLTTRGASLDHGLLRKYDAGPRGGGQPIVLVSGESDPATALVTPLEDLGFGSLAERSFTLESQSESEAGHSITFRFESGGVAVRKTYVFPQDGYAFELRIQIENHSNAAIAPRFDVAWGAGPAPGTDFKEQALATLHEGSVTRSPLAQLGVPGFFDRDPDRVVDFPREIDWAGIDVSYFLRALLPDQPAVASARFAATTPGREGIVQVYFDPVQMPPGQSAERVYRAYAGPKDEELLEALGGGLIRAIDLGYTWVVPLTRFFHWLLQALYSVVPNYGVAIIVLTVLVRLVTAPLTTRQMRSMERMRALAPKLEELKAKFADDRQKQSEEMMRLYRKEGVNPLGGCLPMVLQIPVFIGLFYALRSSIELRHSPFVGWISDLSVPEALFTIPGLELPVRVLPLLMGASMVVQQKLTPMQMDPAQARMMLVLMPVMMTVMFYQFPSGLVLYWMVSNVLAIAHQLWIGRRIRAAA
jgi:YidC/Oxa1 family membrane protein insertase